MRVAIIGTRNHAARLRAIAARHSSVDQIIVFHPDASRLTELVLEESGASISKTADFDPVLQCDAVLIGSPSETHRTYLERLQAARPYVLCEKPIATTREDLDWLSALPPEARRKIDCNHNYAHTDFARSAIALIASGDVGLPIHLQASATHGLAFKPGFSDNWRFRSRDPFASITGNLGIHYLHLALKLFGEPQRAVCHRSRANPQSADADTSTIFLTCSKGQSASLHLSYAAPYGNTAKLSFTDGVLELDDGRLRLFSPRDSFDEAGRFATPSEREIARYESSKAYYDASLARSLDAFLEVAASGRELPDDGLSAAVRSAELVLELCADSDVVDVVAPPSLSTT